MTTKQRFGELKRGLLAAVSTSPVSNLGLMITGVTLFALGVGALALVSGQADDPGNKLQILGLILCLGGMFMSVFGAGRGLLLLVRRIRKR